VNIFSSLVSLVSASVRISFFVGFHAYALRRADTTFGCYHFLFRLLALGQSVFLLHNHTDTYWFSGNGVQKTKKRLAAN
jgi:hypothetical protein